MPKPSKYRAVPTVVDGTRFASKKEARRYSELRLMEKAGEIHLLETQPRYDLIVNGQKVCTYVADFRYYEGAARHEARQLVIEDVKGIKTPAYRIKAKLMKALYGVEIRET